MAPHVNPAPGVSDPVAVACASNAAYALPLAVMLRSAVNQLEPMRELVAYIVDDGIDSADKMRVEDSLPERASVHWLSPNRSGFDGLPLWGRMPITTYDKLTIADLVPPGVTRVIWLDCDMLILADLAGLWESPMNGKHTLAVEDSLVPTVSSRFGVAGYEELGLSADAPYFNAGVMMIDTILWRRDEIARRALKYLMEYGARVFFWDQEALNVALAGRWDGADPRWNWSANLGRLSANPVNNDDGSAVLPWIVHFNGNLKPWQVPEDGPINEQYFRTLDETSWKGWRPARTARAALLGWYGSSRLRRVVYPAEQWGIQILRRFSQT